ncbi:GNAT family protein [Streptomyces scabiei]|uniref:GNAT family N-acetyltransferase n=1 Tax=Streptomyces scabiei TaxID=1930 RepID=UPI0007742091|nr:MULTISPECIES: GNAT family protein [Streptomyces]MBP5863619.1 GNAT family N-acetyltransferase [Streptomyces sp. LBUM 1484]MBP5875878.1 GNAT family N-acetyltransferase [Streptomyces sp. LBUM 1477]MBP5883596.1 GNAT family N-acetyltransferase [Streptomyces sp. LBUM 1487]MBP5899623.1 GNAT family N-acetyltransferase [Streptomyces sp. LBUM 1488]MDW8473108.1 GNAT family protein [Streptomyces scabiei]
MSFSRKPVLTGERAVLRPFTMDDAPVMARILADPEVVRLTGSPAEEFGADRLRSWYGSRNDHADRLDLAIVDRASGELVGEAVLNEWDEANRSCCFRILIGPRGRGRGLGTEAVRLTVGHAFEEVGLHRVSLYVFTHNPRARRVYEKAGFVAEGVERQTLWQDGTWIDAVRMSVLAPEWAGHRGRPGGHGERPDGGRVSSTGR